MASDAEHALLKHQSGQFFEYSSGNTLASSLVRDAVGGQRDDVLRFAQRELFAPAGMQHVTTEFDNAGTPIGSIRVFATARDWARFGNRYANDGVAEEKRILVSDWLAYSTNATPATG